MKMERHSKIVELIGKYEIETQEELAEYLNKEGYNVTQATVSRDIRELKLSKIQTENGGQKYAVFHPQTAFNDKYTRILHDSFVSMDMAQNILVIKTVSGMAMRDEGRWVHAFFAGTADKEERKADALSFTSEKSGSDRFGGGGVRGRTQHSDR